MYTYHQDSQPTPEKMMLKKKKEREKRNEINPACRNIYTRFLEVYSLPQTTVNLIVTMNTAVTRHRDLILTLSQSFVFNCGM